MSSSSQVTYWSESLPTVAIGKQKGVVEREPHKQTELNHFSEILQGTCVQTTRTGSVTNLELQPGTDHKQCVQEGAN
jgi:hypothetical protein